MKRGRLLVSVGILFSLVLLIAAFNPEAGYRWLIGKSSNGNVANDIPTAVLAGLAFRDTGAQAEAEQVLAWIKSKQDVSGCFPSGSCRVKDTALAHWFLQAFNEDTAKSDAWLRSSLSSTLTSGNWYLQVATMSNGTCKVSYEKASQQKSVNVPVDAGRFPLCSGSTFFDVNTCLESGLLSSVPVLDLDVDCSSLGSAVIAIVFQSGNTFYLFDEASTGQAKITLNNGCFGRTAKASCDFDASLYAAWALSEAGSSLSITPWVEANHQPSRVVDNALLLVVTQKQGYLDKLKSLQKSDGSFGSVYDTALAVYALKKAGNTEQYQKGVDWLKSQQRSDGSWDGKELETSSVLFAAFTDTQLPVDTTVPSPGSNDFEDEVCGNYLCEPSEDPVSCPQDCSSSTDQCNYDGVCDAFLGESSLSCDDCSFVPEPAVDDTPLALCGNELVDSGEVCDGADDVACPGLCNADCTCAEESSSWGWLITLLIILLIAVAVYYWYTHMKKKPAVASSQKPSFGVPSSAQSRGAGVPQVELRDNKPVRTKVEDELDKALEEAKKLFGKK
ncbi:MAG TPA: prenyltransferase/squalene oxidase repeat-containing protein [Candidatus Nanoarchaeia archaeon]|nr:prenyltransferase/squalene oxidase repeat-containing protein [Candidatus Nanoarchaeia archaeon]